VYLDASLVGELGLVSLIKQQLVDAPLQRITQLLLLLLLLLLAMVTMMMMMMLRGG